MARRLPAWIAIPVWVLVYWAIFIIWDDSTSDVTRVALAFIALACFVAGIVLYVVDWKKGV